MGLVALADSGVQSEQRSWLSRRPVSLSLGTSLLIQAANVLTGVLLARILGPAGRGELAAVLLWPSVLAAIGSLGIYEATSFHVARGKEAVGTLVGTAAAIAWVQSVFLVGVGLGLVPLVLSHYGARVEHAGMLFLAFVPLNLVSLYAMATLNGLGRFGLFSFLRVLVIAVATAFVGGLALAHVLSPRTAVFSYLAANLVNAVIAVALVRRVVPGPFRVSRTLARQMAIFGLKSHSANVSGLVNERLDQLMISVFLAPARLGLYAIAGTVTALTSLIGGSVAMIALPSLARLEVLEERARAARRFVVLTIALSALVTAPLIVLAPTLITFFFGSAFAPVANVARILLVAAVVFSTNRVLTAILNGIGRPLDAGVGETLALVATVGGLAVLLPTLGLTGAALASLLAYVVSGCWMARRVMAELGIRPARVPLFEGGEIDWPATRASVRGVRQ
jgi:O-antigen/teichoic acid export membrane protein